MKESILAHREKTKNIGVRITPAKFSAVERVGEQLDLNIQETVEAAIDVFLVKSGVPVPEPGSPSPEEQSLIRKLLDLLRSSDDARIEVVKFALDAHAKEQRAHRKAS